MQFGHNIKIEELNRFLANIEDYQKSYDTNGIRECPRSELSSIFSDPEAKITLFPGGILNIFQEPFDLIDINLQEIYRNGRPVLVRSRCSNKNGFQDGRQNSRQNYESISIGTPVASCWPRGLRYDVDYYGNVSTNEIVSHILMQIQLIPKFYKEGTITIPISVPQGADLDSLRNIFHHDMGFDPKGANDVPVVVMEYKFDEKQFMKKHSKAKI